MSKKFLQILVLLVFLFSSSAFAITEDEAARFAQQARERALAEGKKDNVELSSMYFINALSFKPGDMDIITDYADTISKFAQNGLTDTPINSLEALENFLTAQVMAVKPDDVEKIVKLREKISSMREKLIEDSTDVSTEADADVTSQLSSYINRAEVAANIQEYMDAMESANRLLMEYEIEDAEIAEKFQTGLMMKSGVVQINDLIARTASPDLAPLQLYYLQLAETSLQQLTALSLGLPPSMTQEVIQIKTALDKRINEISELRSKTAFEHIEREYAALKESNAAETMYQKKIGNINRFMQNSAAKSQEITSAVYSAKLENVMEEIQTQVVECRVAQEKAYNAWAVQQMKLAAEGAKVHDRALFEGKFRDPKAMREIMTDKLSPIDTRLLNFGAQQCFNAVFSQWYSKLDEENQRVFDEAMAFEKKHGLEDF